MEWISIKDKLPDSNVQEVICVRKTKNNTYYSVPLTWRHDGFYFFLETYFKINDVVYWMPLPEPPIETC